MHYPGVNKYGDARAVANHVTAMEIAILLPPRSYAQICAHNAQTYALIFNPDPEDPGLCEATGY